MALNIKLNFTGILAVRFCAAKTSLLQTPLRMNNRPVSFPHWKTALAGCSLNQVLKDAYYREILTFLRYCKTNHAGATTELAKHYLLAREKVTSGPAREALRWFYREGARSQREAEGGVDNRVQGRAEESKAAATVEGNEVARASSPSLHSQAGPRRPMQPPLAATDLGETPWEQALIKAARERGFLWRTEQTYREWSVRFARFIAPRSPYGASGEDVASFLSVLAVEGRASASAQKQALNALVFLMQEALHRDLGEMEFNRAAAKRRAPTILSQGECKALFAQLEGTPRLMVELAYGAGLRLMELLRLRVHHLDIERGRLQVLGGKGDKDRVTVLPVKLVPALKSHLEGLREQWVQDRNANVPGVWLPEGLARKYPKAGVSWEWQWVFPARELSRDPASGITRRHHLSDTSIQRTVKQAATKAGLNKRVTPHTFRHCFGTHLLEGGTDIRTVQELMGHADIRTTQIYLHVMQKPGLGVRSPLDG